jgi:hypothetical protein
MVVALRSGVLARPSEVADAELERAAHRGQLRVIDEHDPALLHESPDRDEIEEDGLGSVVPVDEGEIEPPPLGDHAREDDLRLLLEEMHEVANPGLRQELQPDSRVGRSRDRTGVPLIHALDPPPPWFSTSPERWAAPLRMQAGWPNGASILPVHPSDPEVEPCPSSSCPMSGPRR